MSDESDSFEWLIDDARERATEGLEHVRRGESVEQHLADTVAAIQDLRYVGEWRAQTGRDGSELVSPSAEFARDLDRITSKRELAVEDVLVERIERLLRDIPDDVHTAFCLDPVGIETSHALSRRGGIEYALQFLSADEVPDRLRGRIEGVDAVLYQKYTHECPTHRDELDVVAVDYYPDDFWWRHPEQFRPENEGPHVDSWHEQTGEAE
ncbi:hypothetical protein RYH80_10445 [Halobaculum sp. MBLA0147]|uniref:hypothetical protein n=1 Tax=Halobaculum sp. MBLA0147 TaxID=3079934 RepID=UPI0035243FB3